MKRLVQPEILDSLPEGHPDAVANRRDLRLINAIMGNFRWFCRELPPLLRPDDRLLELGAGTGELGLSLYPSLRGKIAGYCGIDFWSRPASWPEEWEWEQANLLTFERYAQFTVILANLILHQFEAPDLRRLGNKIRDGRPRVILASEPARRRVHQHQLIWLRPLGLHPVSRHDGHISIAAGFRGKELAELLGLAAPDWQAASWTGLLGSHRTMAIRHESRP